MRETDDFDWNTARITEHWDKLGGGGAANSNGRRPVSWHRRWHETRRSMMGDGSPYVTYFRLESRRTRQMYGDQQLRYSRRVYGG